MKKFAKMSLVAALAVAGFTSTASATDLTEAIKGVDISGQVRYRMEDNSTTQVDQDVNIDVTVKVPVNDNVTFVANANWDNDDQGNLAITNAGNTDNAGNATFGLDNYYFQYVNGATTVLLGAQDIPGRMTDAQTAQGVVGLYNAGAFTVGAAGFYNNALIGEAIYSVIAMGSVGPVSLLGQYATVTDVMDSYNLKADATFGPIKAGVEYTSTELDSALATTLALNKDDRDTFKAYVSGSMDIVSATLAYVSTGDNGSGSIDNQLVTNTETPAEFLLWQMGSARQMDLSAWALDVSAKVTDTITLRAAYADGERDLAAANDQDISEYLGQVSYQMSKNLLTYVRYSNLEREGLDDNHRGRVEVKYSF